MTSPPSDDKPDTNPPVYVPPPGFTPLPGYQNWPGYADPNQAPPPLPRQGQGQQPAPGYGAPPAGYTPPGPGGMPPSGTPGDNYPPTGPPGGYAPMPGPGSYAQQEPKGDLPGSVLLAQRLIYARVALDLLGLVLELALYHQAERRLLRRFPNDDPQRIHQLTNVIVGFGVAVGIVAAVFYVFLAVQVGRGRNWARIVVWVFCGLGLLGVLASVAAPTALPVTRIFALIGGIIDVVIIVSLARRESGPFFR